MPAGRPTDYKPEYCDKVIELGKVGASKAEMALELGCSRVTMDAWAAEYPEFLYSVNEAISIAQGWWEMKGRVATFESEGFSATSYAFNMKNRFKDDWRDKTESDVRVTTQEASLDELK